MRIAADEPGWEIVGAYRINEAGSIAGTARRNGSNELRPVLLVPR